MASILSIASVLGGEMTDVITWFQTRGLLAQNKSCPAKGYTKICCLRILTSSCGESDMDAPPQLPSTTSSGISASGTLSDLLLLLHPYSTCFFFYSQPAFLKATTFQGVHLPAFSTQLGIIPPSESPLIVTVR